MNVNLFDLCCLLNYVKENAYTFMNFKYLIRKIVCTCLTDILCNLKKIIGYDFTTKLTAPKAYECIICHLLILDFISRQFIGLMLFIVLCKRKCL